MALEIYWPLKVATGYYKDFLNSLVKSLFINNRLRKFEKTNIVYWFISFSRISGADTFGRKQSGSRASAWGAHRGRHGNYPKPFLHTAWITNFIRYIFLLIVAKGQLISKCLFDAFNSPKKWKKTGKVHIFWECQSFEKSSPYFWL